MMLCDITYCHNIATPGDTASVYISEYSTSFLNIMYIHEDHITLAHLLTGKKWHLHDSWDYGLFRTKTLSVVVKVDGC